MRLSLIFIALICFPTMVFGQGSLLGNNRSEDELRAYFEEEARRTEEFNRWLEEQNKRTQNSLNALDDALNEAVRRSISKQNSSTGTVTIRPSGGLMIYTDESRVKTSSAKALLTQQRKQQREQEHREWLERRREEIAEQRRRQAEREMRRRQEEIRRRQEQYNRVYTTEYIREGERMRQLSDNADWRVGEGANIMDRRHTASSLMTTNVQRNFSNTPILSKQKYSIRSLAHRRTAVTGLDPHAIPWATMKANARPWDEWEAYQPVCDIAPALPVKPAIPLTNQEIWTFMQEKLGSEKINMIRAAINHECNGIIPEILYEESLERYYFYDQRTRKIISVDTDGSKIIVHQLTEKDSKFSDFFKNMSLSLDVNASKSLSSKLSINPGSDQEVVSYTGKIGNVSSKISNKGYSVTLDNVSVQEDYNGNNAKISVKKDISVGDELKKKNQKEFKGELLLFVTAVENSTQISHRTYYLSDSKLIQGIGVGGTVGAGLTIKGSTSASLELERSGLAYGTKIKAEATLANAGLDATVMIQPPGYKGMCFATLSGESKLGFAYTLSGESKLGFAYTHKSSKTEGKSKSSIFRSFQKGILNFSGGAILKCYMPQEYVFTQSETLKP